MSDQIPRNYEVFKAFHQKSAIWPVCETSKLVSELQQNNKELAELAQKRMTGLNIKDLFEMAKGGLLPVATASKVRSMHAEILEEAETSKIRNQIGEGDGLLERRRKYEESRKSKEKLSKAIDPRDINPHAFAPPETHAERIKRLGAISEWRFIRNRIAQVLKWSKSVASK